MGCSGLYVVLALYVFGIPATKRKPPAGPKPTDAEAVELFRTMIASSGVKDV